MDHYILPPGVEPYITVPCKCSAELPYDGGDIFTFPARNKWTDDEVRGSDEFGGRSPLEIESFFQSWLYFGTLTEVSKLIGLHVTAEDFITRRSNDAELVIMTKGLPRQFQSWSDHLREAAKCDCPTTTYKGCHPLKQNCSGESPCPKAELKAGLVTAFESAVKIIEVVGDLIRHFCWKPEMVVTELAWPVSPEVTLSIRVLASTLLGAIGEITLLRASPFMGGTTLLEQRLADEKWCPLRIMMARGLDVDGLYYIAANPEKAEQDHKLCQTTQCVADDVDEEQYTTKHVTDDCKCAFESPPEDELLRIIQKGGTPLLRWTNAPDGKGYRLTVSEDLPEAGLAGPNGHPSQTQYIAISHVWADGMGNPVSNSLPICRIAWIQEKVHAVAIPERIAQDTMPFWMDTLCVPVRPELGAYRKQCIAAMGNIYEQSSAVLVLDSSVLSIPISSPTPQKCVRIYQSSWQRRLWTFQEGFLSTNTHFQFSDAAQESRDLGAESRDFEGNLARKGQYHHFPETAIAQATPGLKVLRSAAVRIREGVDPLSLRWNILAPLSSGIWQRRTTRKSDEILCMATMMAIDPQPFLDIAIDGHALNNGGNATGRPRPAGRPTPAERAASLVRDQNLADRRMELFVAQIGTFYASIIFRRVPRLPRDGYRWAQRSFLGHSFGTTPPEYSSGEVCHTTGGVGLRVKYPGVSLDAAAASKGLGSLFVVSCEQDRLEIELYADMDGRPPRWDEGVYYCLIMRATPSEIGAAEVEVMLGSWTNPGHLNVLRSESCGQARLTNEHANSRPKVSGFYLPVETEWIVR